MKHLILMFALLLTQPVIVVDGDTPVTCVTIGDIVWCN
jgi:hypothetical protein